VPILGLDYQSKTPHDPSIALRSIAQSLTGVLRRGVSRGMLAAVYGAVVALLVLPLAVIALLTLPVAGARKLYRWARLHGRYDGNLAAMNKADSDIW
jgi:hypothetical protein